MTLQEIQLRRWHELQSFACTVGAHNARDIDQGACVMELAAYVAGEDWTDHPKCVDPVLSSAAIRANDNGPQWVRDALRDRIPAMVGTRDSAVTSRARAEILAWAAVKEIAPYWLDLAGLKDHAAALRGFTGTLSEARDIARRARSAAYAAAYAAAAAAAAAAYAAAAAAAYAAADADADAAAYAAYAAYAADAAAADADADAAAKRFAEQHARPAWEMFLGAMDRAIGWVP
jgi:regulator of protease activity HflC (stomatin/prohibitin superfamily)